MRPLRHIARLLALLLLSLVLYARPMWIVWGGGGILAGLGIRYLKGQVSWKSAARFLLRLLVTTVCFIAGFLPIFRLRQHPRILLAVIAAGAISWMALDAKTRSAWRKWLVLVCSLNWLLLLYFALYWHAAANLPLAYTRYSSRIDLSPDGANWTVRSEIAFDQSDTQTFLAIETEGLGALKACGWQLDQNGTMVKGFRQWTQEAKGSRLTITTVNALSFERDLHCGDYLFEIPANSQTMIFAPKYAIAKTFPDSNRSEILGQERQRFAMPLAFGYGESPVVRFEVINPLLRNWICASLLDGLFWVPLAGLWAIACAVFAEQIKGKMVVPVMKWIFRRLGIRWFSEKDEGHDGGNKDEKPLIIIP